MNAITITAYNRPQYLEKVIDSILENDISGFDSVFCAIEPEMAEENTKQFNRLFGKFQNVELIYNKMNMGVRHNPFNVLNQAFSTHDFVFYLEDDQILSPDAFDFIRFYQKNYEHDETLLCSNLYNYESNSQADSIVTKEHQFCAIGMGIFKWQWDRFFRPYWFDEDVRLRHGVDIGGKGGWDWSIRAVMKEFGIRTLVPALSRSKHIGEVGIHCDVECFNKMFRDHPYATKKVEKFYYVNFDCASI